MKEWRWGIIQIKLNLRQWRWRWSREYYPEVDPERAMRPMWIDTLLQIGPLTLHWWETYGKDWREAKR